MPPRYAYWTILVDDQPTAFRAGSQEDLMPTFKRLKAKNPSAKMMWWQNGKLWESRLDAQEAMRARGEMGRAKDVRQGGGFRSRDRNAAHRNAGDRNAGRRSSGADRKPQDERDESGKLDWKPKGAETSRPPRRAGGPEWHPKAESLAPRDHLLHRSVRDGRKTGVRKPEWKPKGAGTGRGPKNDWSARRESSKLEWKPKGAASAGPPAFAKATAGKQAFKPSGPKRKWVPKEEYKKSQGIEAKRDQNWRPGGEHKDPRQKYKDAKKAKWGRFKQNIRQKWDAKQGRKKREQ